MRAQHASALLLAVLATLRPYQWLKNILVFVPLMLAHRLGNLEQLGTAASVFIAFSLCASAIYVLNDLHDVSADRTHPHKRDRPIASGRLPSGFALAAGASVLTVGLVIAMLISRAVAGVLATYLVLMVAYTFRLKRVVLLDGLALAGGYALRVFAGGLAAGLLPSPRLLAFCIFLFFSLALVKRYAELTLLSARDGVGVHARSYLFEDREFIVALGVASGVMSVLVLALYMSMTHLELRYARAELIWVTCVLLLYWISYVWLTAHRGRMTDDPLVFAVRDRLSLSLLALMGVAVWLAV